MKKIISAFSILTILGIFAMPAVVMAQVGGVEETCNIRTTFSMNWPGVGEIKFSKSGTADLADPPILGTTYKTAKGLPCMIDIINSAVNWITAALVGIVVIFIVIAAFDFLTSSGDEKKLGKAKDRILYAVIALIVMILSRAIVPIVKAIVGY